MEAIETGAVKKAKPTKKEQKNYRFELYPVDEKLIPTDESGRKRAPYPPLYTVANGGQGINPKTGEQESWRYFHSFQKSIWVSEQPETVPTSWLTDARNDLTFRRGYINVKDFEKGKLAALQIQDGYYKCVTPLDPNRPKIYFMVDQDEQNLSILKSLDDAFEAEKKAREMKKEDMYALASLFAIDLDQADISIRTQLVLKSKEHPKAFLRESENPAVAIRFMFLQALQENIISSSIKPGKIVWVDTQTVRCDIKEGQDAADYLTKMWVNGDKAAVKLSTELKNLVDV
jgi:hypothetical protein